MQPLRLFSAGQSVATLLRGGGVSRCSGRFAEASGTSMVLGMSSLETHWNARAFCGSSSAIGAEDFRLGRLELPASLYTVRVTIRAANAPAITNDYEPGNGGRGATLTLRAIAAP